MIVTSWNFPHFLFAEIKCEINGIVVDQIKNPGVATTMKNYLSITEAEKIHATEYGWASDIVLNRNDKFNYAIPLKKLMGFFADYKKIIICSKMVLILIPSRNDLNIALYDPPAFMANNAGTVLINFDI